MHTGEINGLLAGACDFARGHLGTVHVIVVACSSDGSHEGLMEIQFASKSVSLSLDDGITGGQL